MSDNREEQQPQRSTQEGPPWKLILLLVIVVALAVFFFQNGDNARVHFLWFDGEWPLWLLLAVAVVIGVVLDRLGAWQWRRARRRGTDR